MNSFLGVRTKLDSVGVSEKVSTTNPGLEAELARVHAMLAHNSKVYKVFVYNALIIFIIICNILIYVKHGARYVWSFVLYCHRYLSSIFCLALSKLVGI